MNTQLAFHSHSAERPVSRRRSRSGRIAAIACAALLWLVAFAGNARGDDPDPFVFESSAHGSAGGGLSIGANPAGFTFRVLERTAVTGVGAEFNGLGSASVYAALHRLNTPQSVPDVAHDTTLIATTLLQGDSSTAADGGAPLSATLEPGWYALTFGIGRYGATATNFAVVLTNTGQPTAPQTVGPYTVDAATNARSLQGVKLRMFVRGHALPPLPPTTAFLMETARPAAWWTAQLWSIEEEAYFYAARFTLARKAQIDRTSAWLMNGSGSVFAAIVRLNSPGAALPAPGTPAFTSAVVATTIVPVGRAADEYAGAFGDLALDAGSYALVYGSGLFGANGYADAMGIADQLVGPATETWLGLAWVAGYVDLRLTLSGPAQPLEVTPDPVDFGSVPIGGTATRTLTLRNLSGGDLHVGSLGIDGDALLQFTLGTDADTCADATLPAQGECAFSVDYRPSAPGPATAQLAVVSDATPMPYTVDLSGNGLRSYTVTPSAQGQGTIAPDTPQIVAEGAQAQFTLTPQTGHHLAGVGGDCPGALVGDTFTAGPIVAACNVVANFALDPPSAIAAVSGTPQSATVGNAFAAPLTVRVTNDSGLGVPNVSVAFAAPDNGASAQIAASAVTDADGYASAGATANAVVGRYAVSASADGIGTAQFELENLAPDVAIAVSIDDGRGYAAYGKLLDYRIVVRNDGNADASGVAIGVTLPDTLDAAQAGWTCLDASGGACTASGEGALDDHADVPAHGSVSYLLSVPLRADAEGVASETRVQTSGPYAGYLASGSDTDVLVVLRDGFDDDNALVQTGWLNVEDVVALPLDGDADASEVRALLAARAIDRSGFRIETLAARVRIVVADRSGQERATPWAAASAPSLAFVQGDDGIAVLLDGTQPPLTATLASPRSWWRVHAAAGVELPTH